MIPSSFVNGAHPVHPNYADRHTPRLAPSWGAGPYSISTTLPTPRVRHCGRACPRAWAFLPSMWAHPCCSYTSTEDEPDRRYPRSFARPVGPQAQHLRACLFSGLGSASDAFVQISWSLVPHSRRSPSSHPAYKGRTKPPSTTHIVYNMRILMCVVTRAVMGWIRRHCSRLAARFRGTNRPGAHHLDGRNETITRRTQNLSGAAGCPAQRSPLNMT